ncbi:MULTISPECIES: DUF2169 family type VI secretion system accessory protein [Providencia]|uniref:DUF2169 domain-containing protein n=1 Tax=Providencia rettgeri TaxID=587 RepID=A0A427HGI4_PRORE|nr:MULTISPECIES: DUF2169 domain-containing protein [Providencia]ELR5075611.1 DUF2169 domain-containing protein [Providencia stuartii]ELR5215988.1 DUF2169 domain-containing protein [Providencia rettgeri]MBV2191534.1 DUF2169 domain-containing protein [Providencia rettgeri]
MFEVMNYTPFPHLLYQKYGKQGALFNVLAFRQTFRLKTGGHYSDLNNTQFPLVMADDYYHTSESSSLIDETDLVLGRPCTNIHIRGVAKPKDGIPTEQWRAGIRVKDFSRTWTLTGPSYWQHEKDNWQLTAPLLTDGVSLRHEMAYGGRWINTQGETDAYAANPVGIGFYPDISALDKSKRYPAPQIIEDTITTPREHHVINEEQLTLGSGPVSRWWMGRLEYAGTYDKHWEETRFPFYPDDFDEQFFNSAPVHLRYPGFLAGNEPILLEGLLPESSTVVTALPDYQYLVLLQDIEGELFPVTPLLDTLTIDLDNRFISVVRRVRIPAEYPIKQAVISVVVPSQTKGACHVG